jgi:hypothetical protein
MKRIARRLAVLAVTLVAATSIACQILYWVGHYQGEVIGGWVAGDVNIVQPNPFEVRLSGQVWASALGHANCVFELKKCYGPVDTSNDTFSAPGCTLVPIEPDPVFCAGAVPSVVTLSGHMTVQTGTTVDEFTFTVNPFPISGVPITFPMTRIP